MRRISSVPKNGKNGTHTKKSHKLTNHRKKRKIQKILLKYNPFNLAVTTRKGSYSLPTAMLRGIRKGLSRGLIASSVHKRFVKNVTSALVEKTALPPPQQFLDRYTFDPPPFLLISPHGRCNLSCTDCLAHCTSLVKKRLEFHTVNRLISEENDLWGRSFTVISGGEPLLWRSGEKDILDVMKLHLSHVFILHTNGTLISEEIAQRMAKIGNVSPIISVVGLEKETNRVRGKNVFKTVMRACEYLREAGVPFGISINVNVRNADRLLSDELLDFYLEEQGALYVWLFHHLPMETCLPQKRITVYPKHNAEMFFLMRQQIEKRKVFITDFWNKGPYIFSCVAHGEPSSYFAIDWNGDVIPCTLFPYNSANINEIYAKGGDLNDAVETPLFSRPGNERKRISSRNDERSETHHLHLLSVTFPAMSA